MNRLQKKCFIASTGFHLLLALILLIGPAFLSSDSKTQDVQTIEFIPLITTDANISGGGNPKGGLPAPAQKPTPPPSKPELAPPAPPQAEVKPEKTVKPEPKVVEDPPKADPESFEVSKSKKNKIEVNTTLVTRNNVAQEKAKARAAAEARAARESAAASRRLAQAFSSAVTSLSGDFSGSTSIELKGPGGGGIPYGNWKAGVKKVYTDAWVVPDGVNEESAKVAVDITVARDGEVTATKIIRTSGNALVDQSVRAVLDRVRYVPPLPADSEDKQRTIGITFDVKAKQGLG